MLPQKITLLKVDFIAEKILKHCEWLIKNFPDYSVKYYGSSRLQMCFKVGVLENSAIFTKKTPVLESITFCFFYNHDAHKRIQAQVW